MKITVNNKEKQSKEYPKLMIYKKENREVIVLVKEYGKGTYLKDTLGLNDVGDYCESLNMDVFEDFEGEITLSN